MDVAFGGGYHGFLDSTKVTAICQDGKGWKHASPLNTKQVDPNTVCGMLL